MTVQIQKLKIPDVLLLTPKVFHDARGFFTEIFNEDDLKIHNKKVLFAQVNQSRSRQGVLRGLHYQKNPFAQGKLVRVLQGEIFDVAVDIRRGSPHYGTWVAEVLSADNFKMLYIPPGFAHGFLTLSPQADVEYFCTSTYQPKAEQGIIYNDAMLNISWPNTDPILSEKDLRLPALAQADHNFVL